MNKNSTNLRNGAFCLKQFWGETVMFLNTNKQSVNVRNGAI